MGPIVVNGHAEIEKANSPSCDLPQMTLDEVAKGTPFAHPDFIKLEVQGYELEILQGPL